MSENAPTPAVDQPTRRTESPSPDLQGTDRIGRGLPSPGHIAGGLGRLRMGRFSGLAILALVILIFSIWIPGTFLTATTWKTIVSTQAITAILAVALLFTLASGTYDLSAAANLGLSALICGALMSRAPHLSPVVAVLATLAVGAVVGTFNGLLVAWLKMDSFIATLGTSSILLAAAEIIGNGQYVGPFPASFTRLTAHAPLGIPIIALYVLVLAIIAWYVLEQSPAGRRIQSCGANRDAARLAGVKTTKYVFLCCIATAVGASIAGILLASQLASINQSVGPNYLLPAFAAAFLGTTQIKTGRFNVWGTLLAIVLLGTGIQGLNLVGADLWTTDLFNGVALLVAVGVSLLLERKYKAS